MDFRELLREERRRAREATRTKSNINANVASKATDKSKEIEESVSQCQHATLKVWAERSKIDIEEFRRGPIPGVYYIPNWVTQDEEAAILERVYAVPGDNDLWVKLKHRRLQMWGGEVKAPFDPKPLPAWLKQISQTLVDAGILTEEKKPNHALINGKFQWSKDDGPAYFPLVSIISTGAECRVTFEPHRAVTSVDNETVSQPAATSEIVQHFDFQLERRSLLLFTGEAYTRYLHSIDNIEVGTRISLTPINPRARATVTTIPNNEASLYMDDFCLDTPSFVTLTSGMKMRVCEVFWRRVHVQLICSSERSSEQFKQYSAVLCVRRRRHGCYGSSALAISLDRRMHPVRMLSTKAKDSRKLTIGIEYGWRSKRVWFRAPNAAVYEQWNTVIRAALHGNCGGFDEEESLAKWVERSGVSMMETATTSAICSMERFSTDSYVRGCSTSYQSDIPDDEWFAEDASRRELYQLEDTDTPAEQNHYINSLSSICARYRSTNREHTDTMIWRGRAAFSFTGPNNMRYDVS
ncbi:Alpha-ketoglutarate-dependent dioxygenase alkB-like protein [Phytophthora cactorum]|nr:Alpha-ketoglutarate-dependent dioxygenase alkB-like protein [Phytophthora cactorum]